MTFDKLAYIDRLKAVSFTEPQARGMADGLDQALREEVATKSDIAVLRNAMNLLRVELKSEVSGLRGDMKADKIGLLKRGVMLIAGQSAVFTALKLLGH